MDTRNHDRRLFMKTAAAASSMFFINRTWSAEPAAPSPLKGRIKQSICRGNFGKAPWDDLYKTCVELGIVGIDLVGQKDWPLIKQYGLIPSMVPGAGGIEHGLNEKEQHPKLMEAFRTNVTAAAEAGCPNVIVMAGGRHNMSDEEGMENCRLFLQEAMKTAEDKGVTVCMELLNSKVDHPGYMCDHSAWGFELCKRVGSPRFKMLYDIYHMQIMEGDLIRTIRDNIQYIGHFHTAGNPDRKDLDEAQEIFYPPVMKAISKAMEEGKFDGYVAHEFSPKHGLDSLRQAVALCDV